MLHMHGSFETKISNVKENIFRRKAREWIDVFSSDIYCSLFLFWQTKARLTSTTNTFHSHVEILIDRVTLVKTYNIFEVGSNKLLCCFVHIHR